MYFFRKYKNRMMVAIITIILLLIVVKTSKERESLTKVEGIMGYVFSPVKKVGYNIGNKLNSSFEFILNFKNLSKDNSILKDQVKKLEEENMNLKNIIGKSDILKAESDLFEKTSHKLIASQVIGKEPGNWYNTFTIDKGWKDGIKNGTTIVQGIEVENGIILEGLLGRAIDVGPKTSKVVTIIDEKNKVAFHTIRSQDGGVLTGSMENLEGYLYDREADIVLGDKLYTSGLGKAYLKDLYIGEVIEINDVEEEMTKRILVKPAINFKKIYRVYAILE